VERPAALIRARRAFTTIAAAAAIWGGAASTASAGWKPPVEIAAPSSIEVVGSEVASSQAGAAAVSFNEVNEDAQGTAAAFLSLASPHATFGAAQRLGAGAQEVLALAYSGTTLELLTARNTPGQPCCTTVDVTRRGPGGAFSGPQQLVSNVGGGTTGRLVPLADGRLLAVIGAPQGLWVAEARGTGWFARARALTPTGVSPVALGVTGTPDGGSTAVWTEGSGESVFIASGAPGAPPSRPHTLLTVAPGHTIDDLQLVPRTGGLTVAWTESWTDALGQYHAHAMAADLLGSAQPIRPRALSAPANVASFLSLAADGHGDQVAAWNVCSSDLCALQSSIRKAGGAWFGAPSRLGRIDAVAGPLVTMAPDRSSLIAWIRGGQVVLAGLPRGALHFRAPRPLSGALAADLALGFGPSGVAVATWTQGTYSPDVFASLSSGG